MKRIAFRNIVILLLLSLLIPVKGNAQAVAEWKSSETIVVGSEINYPPYCMIDEEGNPTGLSVELFKEAANIMDLEVTFVTGTWDSVKNLLKEGKIDALPLVGRTPEREDYFDFTFPYLSMHGSLVVRSNEKGIVTINDLQGKDVAVMRGDNAEEFLRRHDFGCRIHTTTTFAEALRQLSDGEHDAVVMQRLLALQIIQQEGLDNVEITGPALEEFPQHFSFAVKEGDKELLSRLNEGLAIAMTDGTFHRLRSKWFTPVSTYSLNKRRIIVAGDSQYPPYDFIDENGQPSGFNTALTKAIAREMDLNIQIKLMPWHEARQKLEENKVDAIQGMYYSVDRDNEFDLSPGFLQIRHVMVVPEGKDHSQTLEDLKGKTVAVQQGDIMHDIALEQGMEDDLLLMTSQDEALKAVSNGQADAALVAHVQALYWMDKLALDNLTVTGEPLLTNDYCYAVAQNNQELLSLFAEGISILRAKGVYYEIYEEWLGQYHEKQYNWQDIIRYGIYVLVPALLLLLMVFFWNRMLRKQVNKKTRSLQQEISKRKKLDEELLTRNYEIAEQNEELTTLNEELKQSNEALEQAVAKARESEEKFKNLADTTPAAIMLYQDDRWVYFNNATTTITGYSEEELLGKPFWEIVHPDYREIVKQRGFQRQKGVQAIERYEFVILDKQGGSRWVDLSGSTTTYKGKPAGIISVIEITARKEAEQKLRKSLRDIERITSSVPNVIWKADIDAQGHFFNTYISEAADDLLALPRGTINHSWEKYFSYVKPEDLAEIEQKIYTTLQSQQQEYVFKYQVVKANGEEAWFYSAGKIYDGVIKQVYGYTVDVTEQVRAEKQLKVMNTHLEAAKQKAEEGDKLKTAFLLNISHEIRTPMNAIKGFSDILAEELDDPEQQKEAWIIQSNADQLLNVIDDVLLLSRLQAEKLPLSEKSFLIGDFVEGLLKTQEYMFENRKVTLKKKVPDNLYNKSIYADMDKLNRVLSELIVNAVKYTPAGTVTVGIEPEGEEQLRFFVEDTGMGITPKDRPHIFQRFYRSEDVQKRAIRGTGLGLSIVKYLVDLMGGELELQSESGKGSRFSFFIKTTAESKTVTGKNPDEDITKLFAQAEVLVVEDEEDNFLLLSALLSRKLKKLDHAANGREAMKKAEAHHYDLVLMDVKLPDISGLKLVKILKKNNARLPVIALTAYALPEDRTSALAAGCDNYIAKPIEREVLFTKMVKALEQK